MENSACFIKFGNCSLQITSISILLNLSDHIELDRVIKFQLSVPSMTKKYIFALTIIECNKLGPKIQISESSGIFKKSILTFIRPVANSLCNYHDRRGLKLLSFRLGSTQAISMNISTHFASLETCFHYVLHCSNYSAERLDLLKSMTNIDSSILQEMSITRTLLFGDKSFDSLKNLLILDTTTDYLIKTRRYAIYAHYLLCLLLLVVGNLIKFLFYF